LQPAAIPATPSQQAPNPNAKHALITANKYQQLSIGIEKKKHPQRHIKHNVLTSPKATDATLLLNPTTETGVKRVVCVPSPSCRRNSRERQSPARPQQQTQKCSRRLAAAFSITCPFEFQPQHFTPPSLVTAHEYCCIKGVSTASHPFNITKHF
jgi:hypothetical protein